MICRILAKDKKCNSDQTFEDVKYYLDFEKRLRKMDK